MINIVHTHQKFNIFIIGGPVRRGSTDLLQTVASNIKRYRLERNWNQQELGDRSSVSRTMIVRIESGKGNVSLATLGRIALAFGVSFTEIVQERPLVEPSGLASRRIQVWQGAHPGTRVTLLESFVGQRMTDFFELCLAPGDRYRGEPDQEGTREMIYVVEGTLTLEHENGTRRLKARDSMVFPSDRQYAFANEGHDLLCFLLSVVG
jgi:transcriptional regulator with XRE-family HTH domain